MKKMLVMFGASLFALASNAAYLYWQVDTAAVDNYNGPSGFEFVDGQSYFKLVRSDGKYFDTESDSSGATYGASGLVQDGKADSGVQYYSVGDNIVNGSTYSYYVEMYNNSGDVIARSAPSTSSDITAAYSASARQTASLSEIPVTDISTWHVGGFRAVPEPTSAILMLFGVAMLGLKRKNRSQC